MRALLRTAVVTAVGAGLVVAATELPHRLAHLPGSTAAAASGAVPGSTSVVSHANLVCPGPESVGVTGIDAKTAATPTSVRVAMAPTDLLAQALAGGSGSGSAGVVVAKGVGASGRSPLALGPASAAGVSSLDVSTATSVLVAASGALAPAAVADQQTLVLTGDQRGLSTATCDAPSARTWLVGGGGQPGRRGRVVLTNTSAAAATVNLSVLGRSGPVAATAGRGVVVRAHHRVVVLLDAVAPGESAPVVEVLSSGAPVTATLADTWLDGTTPAGADDAVATTAGTSLVVPAVVVTDTAAGTTLRVAATSSEAIVRVRLFGPQGPVAAPVKHGVVRVPAGSSRNVSLAAVPPGTYAVQLTSDAPVVAGVQTGSGAATAGSRRDLAWTSAQPLVRSLAGAALSPVTAPWSEHLVLTAPSTDVAVDVVTVSAEGVSTTYPVTVVGGTTSSLAVGSPAVSVWLRPHAGGSDSGVAAALVTSYADAAGQLTSVSPLRDIPLTRTTLPVAPAAG